MKVGRWLAELRSDAGMSQEQLAAKSGVPRGTIASIEAGVAETMTAATAKRLSAALGIDWPDFFNPDRWKINQAS